MGTVKLVGTLVSDSGWAMDEGFSQYSHYSLDHKIHFLNDIALIGRGLYKEVQLWKYDIFH
jgi:hypothetical protein